MVFQFGTSARQVRLRLASRGRSLRGEVSAELPRVEWNMSPSRHVSACVSHFCSPFDILGFLFLCSYKKKSCPVHQKAGSPVEEEAEEDDQIFNGHDCPLVQQVNVNDHVAALFMCWL